MNLLHTLIIVTSLTSGSLENAGNSDGNGHELDAENSDSEDSEGKEKSDIGNDGE